MGKPMIAATAVWRREDSFCLTVFHAACLPVRQAYRRIMKRAGHGLSGGTG